MPGRRIAWAARFVRRRKPGRNVDSGRHRTPNLPAEVELEMLIDIHLIVKNPSHADDILRERVEDQVPADMQRPIARAKGFDRSA